MRSYIQLLRSFFRPLIGAVTCVAIWAIVGSVPLVASEHFVTKERIQIGYDPYDGPIYSARVNFSQASYVVSTQIENQWCWAATISNLFAINGHTVSQASIVSDVFGGPVNASAPTGSVIARELNKSWIDANGRRFTSYLTSAYDADVGISTINNNIMIGELVNGRPFVICNIQHCMLALRIDYSAHYLRAIYVFDPWPGQGYRQLTYPETVTVSAGGQCRFIATASVVDVRTPTPTSGTGTGSSGSTGSTSASSGDSDDSKGFPQCLFGSGSGLAVFLALMYMTMRGTLMANQFHSRNAD